MSPALPHLDRQVRVFETRLGLDVPVSANGHLPSSVYREVAALGEEAHNLLRVELAIPPETYLEEMTAFQGWMDLARANQTNPFIARAQVVTQLYFGFVWLRDSLLTPLSKIVPDGITTSILRFFGKDTDRWTLRNAVAHGRWKYASDFAGLECWDGIPPTKYLFVAADDLEAWQTLSRATIIA
jgi:hypothetical protein